jgi:lipoprotein-anchoring transpeptidase ErfK/SrfK
MLTDEAFVNEAKTTLQVTDEEIQKLRDSARDAVLSLSQEETSDDMRSTRNSVDKAKEQVREVLGAEKGDRFIALAQQRWAGGGDALLSAKPNAVPTDTRIVVNAPAYRMDLFKDGQLVKTYKIGIGYPEFPLPTGLRKADTIIFNPTWTPPDEPWVKGKVQPGKKVEAGSKLNPLGPIKIPIGLPSLIHGGKSPDRLGTFASHGCVGLTSPMVQDFAMELSSLSGSTLTMEDVKGYEKNKTETKEVKIEPVPVELRYETIVVEDGKLKIYRDVYERGTNTEENLRRVLETFEVSLDSLNAADRDKILEGLEMMAIDAQGDPVDPDNASNFNSSSNKDAQTKKPSNSSGKVTRNIKGKKELVFELAELRGKGYPASMMKSS